MTKDIYETGTIDPAFQRDIARLSPIDDGPKPVSGPRVRRVSPQVLRHGAATELLSRVVGSTIIALWLGTKSVSGAMILLHADMKMKETAVDDIGPVGVPTGRFQPQTPCRIISTGCNHSERK